VPEVRLSHDGAAAVLTFSHPQRGNALSQPMMVEAAALLRAVRREDAAAIILRGDGERSFCAGYDLAELPRSSGGDGDETVPELMGLLRAIEESTVPVIAAVQGHAIGGGVLLLAHCDLRIGGRDLVLRIPTTRIGMVYPLRGVRRLVAVAGLAAATRWLLLGEDIHPEEAHRTGLLDELLPNGDVFVRALSLAGILAQRAPLAVEGLLRTLRGLGHGADDEAVRRIHQEAMAACVQSEDLREGIAAAAGRRSPRFVGR
jgi:enoyl-CoA hydratase/carnithine racemase